MAAFARLKARQLARADGSRKGSVDRRAAGVVRLLNARPRFCTASSCSGRVLLARLPAADTDRYKAQKKNCSWLMVTHEMCTKDDVMTALEKASGDIIFKFEPFVLHVLCEELQDAQLLNNSGESNASWFCSMIHVEERADEPLLPYCCSFSYECVAQLSNGYQVFKHSVAINSGFRNSGITVGRKGKIMMAVRSTHCLEVPLSHMGKLMVSEEYIEFLIHTANQKMEENMRRIDRFYNGLQLALKTTLDANNSPSEETERNHPVYVRRRKRKTIQKNGICTSPEDHNKELEDEDDPRSNVDIFGEIVV